MRLPSISLVIEMRRWTTCISLISSEKMAHVFFATAAFHTTLSAKLVFPRPGRPPRRMRSDCCSPPVFASSEAKPVGMPMRWSSARAVI